MCLVLSTSLEQLPSTCEPPLQTATSRLPLQTLEAWGAGSLDRPWHIVSANAYHLDQLWHQGISALTLIQDCSTKFAVTGLTEGLAEELRPFGIDVCVIEPGYTRTGFLKTGGGGDGGGDHRIKTARQLSEYDGTPVAATRDAMSAYSGAQPGNVDKCATVIVDVLTKTGVAEGKDVPLRLITGSDTVEVIRKKCEDTLKLVAEWEQVSNSVMGHD